MYLRLKQNFRIFPNFKFHDPRQNEDQRASRSKYSKRHLVFYPTIMFQSYQCVCVISASLFGTQFKIHPRSLRLASNFVPLLCISLQIVVKKSKVKRINSLGVACTYNILLKLKKKKKNRFTSLSKNMVHVSKGTLITW